MNLQPPPQRTIARPVSITGFGYWTGRDVRVEFRPADVDAGISFVRTDLRPLRRIPAVVSSCVPAPRRTTLTHDGGTVEMVEHIMAGLSGLGISNCEVLADSSEMPGGDGSSLQIVESILRAGLVEQDVPAATITPTRTLRVGDQESWLEISPPTHTGEFSIRYDLDYQHLPAVGRQVFEITVDVSSFVNELAPARTFITEHEAAAMRAQGFGTRVTPRDLLVFGDHGPLDNHVRFPDECVRHKILDIVGDFALCGAHICGDVTAYRSGHRLNAELLRQLISDSTDHREPLRAIA